MGFYLNKIILNTKMSSETDHQQSHAQQQQQIHQQQQSLHQQQQNIQHQQQQHVVHFNPQLQQVQPPEFPSQGLENLAHLASQHNMPSRVSVKTSPLDSNVTSSKKKIPKEYERAHTSVQQNFADYVG